MTNPSPAAMEYLRVLLANEVSRQVREGHGDEPMPEYWTELHNLVLFG